MKKKTLQKRDYQAELNLIFRELEEIKADIDHLQKRLGLRLRSPVRKEAKEHYSDVPF